MLDKQPASIRTNANAVKHMNMNSDDDNQASDQRGHHPNEDSKTGSATSSPNEETKKKQYIDAPTNKQTKVYGLNQTLTRDSSYEIIRDAVLTL